MTKACGPKFAFLLLLLCMLPCQAQVRVVSLLPEMEAPIEWQLGPVKQTVVSMEPTDYIGVPPGEHQLRLSQGDRYLLNRRLGFGPNERGNYAVQARMLRGHAYLDPQMAYVRVFHGAVATVPIRISGTADETTVGYGQVSDLLPVRPGTHELEVMADTTSEVLWTREFRLQAGNVYYLMASRASKGKGDLRTVWFKD